MMNKIIGLAVLLLCMSGCVRDNDAIYYPVGDVDIERGGPALEVGEGDVLVVRSYNEEDYPDKVVLVLGNEGTGLRKKVREYCDKLIKIPMRGKINSLNVSVAGGILLSEIAKFHKE